MTPFLSGFVSELTKVAVTFGQPVSPPKPISTPGGGASTAGPPRTFKPPGGGSLSIPKQRMESPAAPPKPTRYRPSPGYRPQPSSDPVPAPAKKKSRGSGKKAPTRDIVPWENAGQRWRRLSSEKAHNLGRRAQEQQKSAPPKKTPQRKGQEWMAGENIEPRKKGHEGPRLPLGMRRAVQDRYKQQNLYKARKEERKKTDATARAAARIKAQQRFAIRARLKRGDGQNLYTCFPAGTLITLANKNQQPIESIEVGTEVLSWVNGDLVTGRVTRTMISENTSGYVTIDQLTSTPNHPYWTPGGWTAARSIVVGDKIRLLRMSETDVVSVTSVSEIENTGEPALVYNLTVDGPHAYFANNVLVHNK